MDWIAIGATLSAAMLPIAWEARRRRKQRRLLRRVIGVSVVCAGLVAFVALSGRSSD